MIMPRYLKLSTIVITSPLTKMSGCCCAFLLLEKYIATVLLTLKVRQLLVSQSEILFSSAVSSVVSKGLSQLVWLALLYSLDEAGLEGSFC